MIDARRQVPGRYALLAGLALGYAVATMLVVPTTTGWGTTFAGASASALAADLAAGVGLILAGLFVGTDRADRRFGALVVLAGVAWLAQDLVGWHDGPALVRSAAVVIAPMFAPLVLQIGVTGPTGHPMTGATRAMVLASYGLFAVLGVARALVNDPLTDAGCWSNCTENVFLVRSAPDLASRLREAQAVMAAATGLVLATIFARRLLVGSARVRRWLWPMLLAGSLVGAFVAARGLLVLQRPIEDPRAPLDLGLFLALAWSTAALALSLTFVVLRSRDVRLAVANLARDLDHAQLAGSVGDALARVTGDPGLVIGYRLTAPERWVDAAGTEMERPIADARHSVTPVVRGGDVVALIEHDPEVVDSVQLDRSIGAATRLAIENERLQAEVLARLRELRQSRMRTVATGDAERLRLERDLHDGVQQRLLALTYDLRVARMTAEREGVIPALGPLDRVLADAGAAHQELRDLAHGIFPAILVEAGLGRALATLANRSPIAVELGPVPEGRVATPAETAAYLMVAESVRDAAARDASFATVKISRLGDQLEVEVEDDGRAIVTTPVHLADRIGAIGGRLTVESVPGRQRLWAEIPCA